MGFMQGHWGNNPPTKRNCPFNFFRTSKDLQPKWTSILDNVHSVLKVVWVDVDADVAVAVELGFIILHS